MMSNGAVLIGILLCATLGAEPPESPPQSALSRSVPAGWAGAKGASFAEKDAPIFHALKLADIPSERLKFSLDGTRADISGMDLGAGRTGTLVYLAAIPDAAPPQQEKVFLLNDADNPISNSENFPKGLIPLIPPRSEAESDRPASTVTVGGVRMQLAYRGLPADQSERVSGGKAFGQLIGILAQASSAGAQIKDGLNSPAPIASRALERFVPQYTIPVRGPDGKIEEVGVRKAGKVDTYIDGPKSKYDGWPVRLRVNTDVYVDEHGYPYVNTRDLNSRNQYTNYFSWKPLLTPGQKNTFDQMRTLAQAKEAQKSGEEKNFLLNQLKRLSDEEIRSTLGLMTQRLGLKPESARGVAPETARTIMRFYIGTLTPAEGKRLLNEVADAQIERAVSRALPVTRLLPTIDSVKSTLETLMFRSGEVGQARQRIGEGIASLEEIHRKAKQDPSIDRMFGEGVHRDIAELQALERLLRSPSDAMEKWQTTAELRSKFNAYLAQHPIPEERLEREVENELSENPRGAKYPGREFYENLSKYVYRAQMLERFLGAKGVGPVGREGYDALEAYSLALKADARWEELKKEWDRLKGLPVGPDREARIARARDEMEAQSMNIKAEFENMRRSLGRAEDVNRLIEEVERQRGDANRTPENADEARSRLLEALHGKPGENLDALVRAWKDDWPKNKDLFELMNISLHYEKASSSVGVRKLGAQVSVDLAIEALRANDWNRIVSFLKRTSPPGP